VDLNLLPTGSSVAIMGYGCDSGVGNASVAPSHLKYSRTQVIAPADAINGSTAYSVDFDANRVNERYFFTPGQANNFASASICPGDSGGPVYRLDGAGKPAAVVGVNAYYDFPKGDTKGISYSNWHTRFNGTWLKDALADSAPSIFIGIGAGWQTTVAPQQPNATQQNKQTGNGTVSLTWKKQSDAAKYSLDVDVGGNWVAPCIDAGILQSALSVVFQGTCPSRNNMAAPLSSVNAFRICSAVNDDWAHATCITGSYVGQTSLELL
jgi:hypothetical protein